MAGNLNENAVLKWSWRMEYSTELDTQKHIKSIFHLWAIHDFVSIHTDCMYYYRLTGCVFSCTVFYFLDSFFCLDCSIYCLGIYYLLKNTS